MEIVISGIVQGVGFRPAVFRSACRVGASGTVMNNGSDVVIYTDLGDALLDDLLTNLPPLSRIDRIVRTEKQYTGPDGFSIIPSGSEGHGASIPADTCVCDRCVEEMFSPGRRSGYPFTTCTDCGARYTLLMGMPYDRPLTSMVGFPTCPECQMEYTDPMDRRFHHQTVCCPACGPSYRLVLKDGTTTYDDPMDRLADMIDRGSIAVIKGWGGMHICCRFDDIARMREWYGRQFKPFAIMARDIDTIRRYAEPTEDEERMLLSPQRPIVLVRKRPSDLTECASPGLDNIGMFLPYTGMHHILFSRLGCDALVMTSANLPGEPMVIDDDAVMELGADAYLLHNQEILNRADDTVMRMFGDRTQYIRRSRGAIPFSIDVGLKGDVVALGAQENLAGCIASDGRLWPTQYIGNGEKIGVPEYLEEAVRRQMHFIGCDPEVIAIDLHPGYANRRFAKALAQEHDAEVIEVQHHWAHAASLMTDNNVDSAVVLTLDGTGHGDDGTAWGGEVLGTDFHGYRRSAHLQYIPLLGAEKALYDLRRLNFAIDCMNGDENHDFNDGEANIMRKLMDRSVSSSSFGRLLDALAYRLGVCSKRTYDGEPAMRLESLLNRGRLIEGYEVRRVGDTVMSTEVFSRIDPKDDPADVAYSIVHNVLGELVASAIEEADRMGTDNIGVSGGVSYNSSITQITMDMVISSDHHSILHNNVPNGDGGISIGQAAIALRRVS